MLIKRNTTDILGNVIGNASVNLEDLLKLIAKKKKGEYFRRIVLNILKKSDFCFFPSTGDSSFKY